MAHAADGRRAFMAAVARLIAGGAAVGVAPLLESCAGSPGSQPTPARWSATFDVSALADDGKFLVSEIAGPDGARILILREHADRFVALSMQCTHEGCIVNPPAGGVITCPCHGSQYDLHGKVLHGPAIYPLARYDVRYDAGRGQVRIQAT